MDEATRTLVRQRAGDRCEYCRLSQEHSPLARLQIEHVIPKKHGGGDEPENLALACIDCNFGKGPNLAGRDPLNGKVTAIFNPRTQAWSSHFAWHGAYLEGITAVGRTTVRVLNINAADRIEHRLEIGPA